MRRALITGITGQDGTYLAQYLLSLGYHVYGMVRGQNNPKIPWVLELCPGIELIEGDLLDQTSLVNALKIAEPDEVYNLGAISFVALSFTQPIHTGEATGLGVMRMLEAIRTVNPEIRFYQASSSEMFGMVRETPQTEMTAFHPRSPYGVAKAYGHYATINYRESYGMFACSGILFNHESPRRGPEFVTRKITRAAARIKAGLQDSLSLGNLNAQRDWGFAGDYVRAMVAMLQQDKPDDFVVATGTTRSVADFCRTAFECVDLNYEDYIRLDPRFLRPAEVNVLVGDASRAHAVLGWKPECGFTEMVDLMVRSDLAEISGSGTPGSGG